MVTGGIFELGRYFVVVVVEVEVENFELVVRCVVKLQQSCDVRMREGFFYNVLF